MKSRTQFQNIFNKNQFNRPSHISPPPQSSLKQSHYFETIQNPKYQNIHHTNTPIYLEQKAFQSHKNHKNSRILYEQNPIKQASLLERSKSQIIPSIYISPYKKDFNQDLTQSNCLAVSNASQITFAKPSQFINNNQKQSFQLISTHKNLTDFGQNVKNDYGYASNNLSNLSGKDYGLNAKSSIKSSFIDSYNSPIKYSIMDKNQNRRQHNFIEPSMFQSQIITMRPFKTTVIFKNQPTDFHYKPQLTHLNFKPQLKRVMSNISVMSQKSNTSNFATKVNFNYITPSKSQNKKPRKLSFKKEDVKNPLNKLTKKKQSSKIKIDKQTEVITNNQVVDEYFPEFKVKRNKMLKNVISPPKRLSIHKKNELLTKQNNQKQLSNAIIPSEKLSKQINKQDLVSEQNKNDDVLKKAQQIRRKIEIQLKISHENKPNKPLQQMNQVLTDQMNFQSTNQNNNTSTNQKNDAFSADKKNYTQEVCNYSLQPFQMNHINTNLKVEKNEHIQEDLTKNHTFIASLDGFSQISEIKNRQKEDSTQITNDTPKKTPLFQFRHDDTLKHKIQTQKFHKLPGYRISLTGQKIPLKGQNNEIFQNADNQISGISKESQVSIPSNDLDLSKKQQNNSSKTTDYEQEMVRKLKQELGLNFSYYKK